MREQRRHAASAVSVSEGQSQSHSQSQRKWEGVFIDITLPWSPRKSRPQSLYNTGAIIIEAAEAYEHHPLGASKTFDGRNSSSSPLAPFPSLPHT